MALAARSATRFDDPAVTGVYDSLGMDVSQICVGHRHPQQGLSADPKGFAGQVRVEEEDA